MPDSATGKHYGYKLFNGSVLHPLDHGVVWHWPWPLDFSAMQAAAGFFPGEHDFSAFAAFRHEARTAPGSGKNVRRLRRADLTADGPYLTFEIEGSGFLYKMVRLIIGALIHAGRGSLDEAGLRALLDCRLDARGEISKARCVPGRRALHGRGILGRRRARGVPLTPGVSSPPMGRQWLHAKRGRLAEKVAGDRQTGPGNHGRRQAWAARTRR